MASPESFNQIPQQCWRGCPLTQAAVDEHGIVLTRGCQGPSYEGPDPTTLVRIRGGEVVAIEPGTTTAIGRAACTNEGFNAWLQMRKAQFNGTGD